MAVGPFDDKASPRPQRRLPDMQRATLYVMRLAEMRLVHSSMDSSKTCCRCGETVGIFPSGQGVIQRSGVANVDIVCSHCRTGTGPLKLAPGAAEERKEAVLRND